MKRETINRAIDLYMFLLRFWVDNGYMPAVREMQAHMGGVSLATVQHYIKVLIKWGWVERGEERSPRALALKRASEVGMNRDQVAALFRMYWKA